MSSTTVFNPASVSALLSAVVSLVGGMGAWVLGGAPDWEDVKPLAWVGLTAALAAACSFTATVDVSVLVNVWTIRVQVLAIALHLAAWHLYFQQWGARPSPVRRWLLFGPILAAGALALVPGAVFHDAVRLRPVPWLGVVYRDPVISPYGLAVYAVLGAFGVAGIVRLVRLRHPGLPFPRMHLAVAGALVAMGMHDGAVSAGLVAAPTPYLVVFALYGPAIVIASLTLRRVVETATDLRRLRTGLEMAVVERTAVLQRTQAGLESAERLASFGRFSTGFAHEVSGPAAVMSASLDALATDVRDDPRDRVWMNLENARVALKRITTLAQLLRIAGRDAGAPSPPVIELRVGPAVDAALATGRASAAGQIALEADVSPGLTVLGHEDGLVQVLANLVLNAIGGIPPGRAGTVRVRAADTAGDRVRIAVEDDGAGMSEAELLNVFEPFWRPQGSGSGLGLIVSRALVDAMGGTLRFESAPGRGTTAILELRRGEPDASVADLPAAALGAPWRARVLVVDDDVGALRAAVERVSAEYEVSAAESVAEALAELAERSFDLVLCEGALSMGGAERLWQELLLRAPGQQGCVVFVAGRAATPAARAFLARQPQPVLERPLDLAAVREALERIGLAPAGEGPGRPARAPSAAIGKVRRR